MCEHRNCPICNKESATVIDSFDFVMPEEYADGGTISLVECNSCGFVYKDIVRDLYGEAKQTRCENRYESFEHDFTKAYLKEEAEAIMNYFGKEMVLLDVGCCTGYLLHYLSAQGIKHCSGLEPSAVSCEKALEKGISVHMGSVYDDIPEFENVFDIIILSQVLEHISELKLCIRQMNKWLKKDGFIFISVPDEQNCDKYYGSISSVLSLEHVNHFGTVALDNLMLGSGFSLLSHKQRNYYMNSRQKEDRDCIMASFDSVYRKSPEAKDLSFILQRDREVGRSIMNLLSQYKNRKCSVRQKVKELQTSGKQYIIWGVSHMALNLLCDELKNVSIVSFTDSDPSKHRLHIMNLPVIPPSEIAESNTEILVMNNNSKNSICQSIEAFGLLNPVHII